ncbi:MAG TPA: ATP-binding protein [Vicinamibacteria bacterium]|nr:ATP-binding protein [Vicinamibacteria bacterium]
MAYRLDSLKTRTALAISSVVVVILVANAVYLIVTKRSEIRRDVQARAITFAQLTKAPICTGYELFYASGYYKFRELMLSTMRLNEDVERILIVNVNGQVLFDSEELDEGRSLPARPPAARLVQEPERLEAVKRLEATRLEPRQVSGQPGFEIIAPHVEDWGRHKLSVIYEVSYRNLRPSIARLVYAIAGLTLLSMLFSFLVAATLARRITRPLEELTAGAQDVALGHFDRRLRIQGSLELLILADAFNEMAGRLKENIAKLEDSNRRLATLNEELKELDRMKSDLLANVSHELRTPLTAIKGYTDYILEHRLGPITEKQEKGLLVVQRNLERLSRSIGALLDFSRMDLGHISLTLQPCQLGSLLEQVATTVRSELDRKRLRFKIDLEADLPPLIADRERLSAVIENLVINAIKFTPDRGSITVSARRVTGSERPQAEITVEDTGIGIPPDQVGRIFQRFHQVDSSSTRRFGGVGLGLAIVKSILDAHGAAVTVESQEGLGTSFRFRLPLLLRGEAAAAPSRQTVAVAVDGGSEVLTSVRADLAEAGIDLLLAPSAAEGAVLLAERRPDVVLLDPFLPDEERAILGQEAGSAQIPLLLVSPLGAAPDTLPLPMASETVVEAGPGQAQDLIAEIRRLIGPAASRGAKRASL